MTSTDPPTADPRDREALLDEVLTRFLSAADAGRGPTPAALLALYPDLADELTAFFADHARFESLAAPLRAGAGETPVAHDTDEFVNPAAATANPPAGLGAFELLEEIGRGGMAIVWKAWHPQLNRTVAVKTIRPDAAANPEALARFRAEARAVARLQHPNIVQIFEVGDHDGRPYLVLEYVAGGSLAHLLNGTPLAAGDAATLADTLARAVDYAHRRGVVHRDLKPANILLTEDYGTQNTESEDSLSVPRSGFYPSHLKIADFGLAVLMDAGADRLTETGTTVGTPTYMAPEQARGRRADIGPAGDVHALGVILYEMLTGRPPFLGVSKFDTLLQVMNDPPLPPRRLRSGVPRDLQTICLKCLEKDPAKRYASAALLADDLRRFLDGRPILARPVGPLGRVTRWCRRQPVLAALFAALTVCSALLAVQWWRAERHASDARTNFAASQKHLIAAQTATAAAETNLNDANTQRAREQESFQLAHRAVKDVATQVSEKELAAIPGLQPLRKVLLERTIRYYQDFLKQRGQDPMLRAELADTCARTGRLTDAIGSKEEALGYYARAEDMYAGLLRETPDDPQYMFPQGQVLNERGNVLQQLGRVAEAGTAYHDALTLFRRMQVASPDDVRLKISIAHVLSNLGGFEADASNLVLGLKHFSDSRDISMGLMRAAPRDRYFRQMVAEVNENIGILLGDRLGRTSDALKTFRMAVRLREDLAGEFSTSPEVQRLLAHSYRLLGEELRRSGGNLDEALATLRKAEGVLQAAAKANPSVTRLQADLASCFIATGLVYRSQRKHDEALAQLQKARLILETLARLHPNVRVPQADLAVTYFQIGVTHVESGNRTEARQAYEIARDLWAKVVQAHPKNLSARAEYSDTLHNLGMEQARFGSFDQAAATIRLAAVEQRAVLAKAPMVERHKQALAQRYAVLADIERKAARPDAAVAAALDRRTIWPDNPAQLFDVACDVAASIGVTTDAAARRRHTAHALDVLSQAVARGFRDSDRLARERVLDPIRNEERFKQLLIDLRRPK